MRDKIKDKQYFEKVLKKEKADIEMFENIVQKSLQEKGESNRGTRNGYSILINLNIYITSDHIQKYIFQR